MNSEKNVKLSSWLLLIILTLIWGSSFILIKRGLYDGNGNEIFTPQQVGALRIVLAGLSLLPYVILRWKEVSRKEIFWLVLVGFFGNTIPAFLFAIGETKVASAVAGMLNGTTPIFVFLIAAIVFKAKFSNQNILGILIGFIGTLGLVYFGNTEDISIGIYSLYLIVATLCYGISVNIIKEKLHDVRPITITALSLSFFIIPCLIYLLNTDFLVTLRDNPLAPTAAGYLLILSVVGTSLALILFNKLVKNENVIFASSVTYLIPIVAIFWGIMDGEILSPMQIAMIGLILSGVFLVNKKVQGLE